MTHAASPTLPGKQGEERRKETITEGEVGASQEHKPVDRKQ